MDEVLGMACLLAQDRQGPGWLACLRARVQWQSLDCSPGVRVACGYTDVRQLSFLEICHACFEIGAPKHTAFLWISSASNIYTINMSETFACLSPHLGQVQSV